VSGTTTRARWGRIALLLAALAVVAADAPRAATTIRRKQDDAARVQSALTNKRLRPLPDNTPVLTLVYAAADFDGRGQLSIRQNNSRSLPSGVRPLQPADALGKYGLVLGVADGSTEFHYLIQIGDPREVRGEAADLDGNLSGEIARSRGGALSARFPFLPRGRVIVFRVAAGQVQEVLFDAPLGPAPFPDSAREFVVAPPRGPGAPSP